MSDENIRKRIIRLLRENPALAARYGRGEIGLRKAEKAAGLVPKDLTVSSADVDKAVRKLAQHYGADAVGEALQALSEREKAARTQLKVDDFIPDGESAGDSRLKQEIIDELAVQKKARDPFFLNSEEFEKLGQWIDAGRYDPSGKTRNTRNRQRNTDAEVREKTLAAFSADNPRNCIEVLTQLKGVAVQTATAIMAMVDPTKYPVLNARAWRQIFGESREPRTIAEYERLLPEIIRLAEEHGSTIQDIDQALREKDIREFGDSRR